MRPLVALSVCAALACSRHRNAAPRTRATIAPAAPAVAAAFPARPPEREEEEVMNPARDLSPYPDTEDGLRALVTDLARAAHGADRERLESLERALRVDDPRVELAFTYSAARALGPGLVTHASARLEARVQALRTLPEPVAVRVRSALGSELAGPQAVGLDPAMTSLRDAARPQVRYYRAELGDPARPVVLEPVAYLGGRWCYLAEAWRELPPTPTPAGSPTVAVR